jgi:hypothetical protein
MITTFSNGILNKTKSSSLTDLNEEYLKIFDIFDKISSEHAKPDENGNFKIKGNNYKLFKKE